jgi:hypothetical protein
LPYRRYPAGLLTTTGTTSAAGTPPGPQARHENFNVEPAWEGRSNRNVPAKVKTITQNFGHRTSHLAGGKDAGEVGGSIYKYWDDLTYTVGPRPAGK